MEDKSCTSSETGQHLLMPNVQLAQLWAKSLKHMPNFTHTHIEKHLILEKEKLPEKKPADAIKHKKDGYRLFKAQGCRKQMDIGGGAGKSVNLGGSGGMHPQIILKSRPPKYDFPPPRFRRS